MARAGSLWLKIGDASNSWEQSSISRWRTPAGRPGEEEVQEGQQTPWRRLRLLPAGPGDRHTEEEQQFQWWDGGTQPETLENSNLQ